MKSKSIYRSFFSPLNNRSCQYHKQLNSIGKDLNYDLIAPNGIIGHFIVFIEAEKLVIPSHGQKGLKIDVNHTKVPGQSLFGYKNRMTSKKKVNMLYKWNSISTRPKIDVSTTLYLLIYLSSCIIYIFLRQY